MSLKDYIRMKPESVFVQILLNNVTPKMKDRLFSQKLGFFSKNFSIFL